MGIGWAAAWALAASLGAGVDARICAAAATRGQELRDSGDLLGAREQLRTCAASECPKEIRTDCGRWLSKVDEMLPSVVLAVREGSADVEGVEVSINGVPHVRDGRPIEMNPGRYRVTASKGGATKEVPLVVTVGERNRLVVIPWEARPAPVAPQAPLPAPPLAVEQPRPAQPAAFPLRLWIPVATGAALAVAGGACAFMSKQDLDRLTATQGPPLTPSEWQATATQGKNLQTAAIVSFAVGGAAIAAGVALGLWGPTHSDALNAAVAIGPGSAAVGVRGALP